MIVDFTLTVDQADKCLIEWDYAADVQVFDDDDWLISSYFIDVTSPDERAVGVKNYQLIEDEDIIRLLASKEPLFEEQIDDAVREYQAVQPMEHRFTHHEYGLERAS